MDRFFDKLGDLLESLLGGQSSPRYEAKDPDMREAIAELDEYLKSGSRSPGTSKRPGGRFDQTRSQSSAPPNEALRRDYATMETTFAAPLPEVRKSYKRLLHKYHPDHFSGDEQKQALANEVTQRLNDAFARIEKYHEKHAR